MSKLFYSTSEVASLFKVNRVTIYRWVKDGKIKAYEIGKNIKIPVSEVGRLLKEFGFSGSAVRDVSGESYDDQSNESVKSMTEEHNRVKSVVAVCDHDGVLRLIEEIFEKPDLGETCKLLTFSDSLEAAIQIGGEKPDLVLLDMKMSGLDGIGLAAQVRSAYQDVKIVLMSESRQEERADQNERLDVFDWLIKPIDSNRLYETIRNALKT
ncbi:MAG: response regulator [Deltaproteobacteria bacterium]|nr:response regulator [Deltaproteobacteria bacterium]